VPATSGHLGLAAELAFGADFARPRARHFGGEGVELVDHRVDGCFFSSRISPFTSTVILRDRVAAGRPRVVTSAIFRTCAVRLPAIELTLSVRSFPGAGDAGHVGLTAEPAFGADPLAPPTRRHLYRRTGLRLVNHRIEAFSLSCRISPRTSTVILARQGRRPAIAGRDLSAMLRTWGRQIAGHRVDAVGQVLPGAGDAGHLGLARRACRR